jgi:hypothetical protein
VRVRKDWTVFQLPYVVVRCGPVVQPSDFQPSQAKGRLRLQLCFLPNPVRSEADEDVEAGTKARPGGTQADSRPRRNADARADKL